MKFQYIKYFLVVGLIAILVGCDNNDGPLEKAGEAMDESVEKTGDAVNDAVDEAKDAVEEAGDKIEDATDN